MKYLILLSLAVSALAQTDYCRKGLCRSGKHIACNNDGNWARRCPSDARLVDLTPYKRIILKSHNEKRNTIASGDLADFPPAKRMATMQWDNELAQLAALNVKQCVMKHDQCRNTDKYKHAGQNLAFYAYSGSVTRERTSTIIKGRIDDWWGENKDTSPEHLAKYPRNYNGPAIGHFTVMAAESNERVGCAASRYTKGGLNHFLLACNYATTNIINHPIYEAGDTASGCKTGTDSTYTSLCSKSETYSNL